MMWMVFFIVGAVTVFMKSQKPKITEAQLLELVREAAQLNGWLFYHTWTSIHSAKGFPDCVLVGYGRLIFVELKNETRKVTDEQQDWLDALGGVKGNVAVWVLRPSGFDYFYDHVLSQKVEKGGKYEVS